MMSKFIKVFLVLIFVSTYVWANNVQVTGVSRTGTDRNDIQFQLSWENSWNSTGVPGNHDAVWVFIKYRECDLGGEWNHALLSTTMTDHSFGSNLTYAKPISVNDRFGNAGNHNTGVLIRRSTIGKGDISPQTISLKIVGASNGVSLDPAKEFDIKVFAIEMVQIPAGEFYAGDGTSTYTLYKKGTGYGTSYGYMPHQITAENSTDTISFGNYYYFVILNSNFPKGYDEFYMMKYEITQGQYCDFLNTIASAAAVNRAYIVNTTGGMCHIAFSNIYYGNYPDRAMPFMSYNDLLSYLDWAALRPMTELEFEKACRGPKDIVPNEYAWGKDKYIEAINISGSVSGSEICTDSAANLHCSGANTYCYGGVFVGSYSYGPLEVGIFARNNTLTREGSGGSYYGVMELSGNVWEQCVQINLNEVYNATATTSPYTGIWGDGQLTGYGLFNTSSWQTSGWFILKGGAYNNNANNCRVSDREYRNRTDYNSRGAGGRGVR